jgi:hypothetical protein
MMAAVGNGVLWLSMPADTGVSLWLVWLVSSGGIFFCTNLMVVKGRFVLVVVPKVWRSCVTYVAGIRLGSVSVGCSTTFMMVGTMALR